MQLRKLKYLKAQNILCFGDEGIEIDFESMGNIILIRGRNLDAFDSEKDCKDASNGAGKSSLPDVIAYAIYGKTIKKNKKLKHVDIINNQAGKKELCTEIIIDDWKIVRTRKIGKSKDTGTLKLFKLNGDNWEDFTRGKGPAAIQEDIVNEVIGLKYDTFINIFIFGDDDSSSFLESDITAKRDIVDNLLGLEKYRGWNQNAKDFVKKVKADIKVLSKEYDHLLVELGVYKNRIEEIQSKEKDWKSKKEQEIKAIEDNIKKSKKRLGSSNQGVALQAYKEAQSKISELRGKLPELERKREKLDGMLEGVAPKYKAVQDSLNEKEQWMKDAKLHISSLQKEIDRYTEEVNKPGTKCPTCNGTFEEENLADIISNAREIIKDRNGKFQKIQEKIPIISEELNKLLAARDKYKEGIKEAERKFGLVKKELTDIHYTIGQLSEIKEPTVGLDERLIQEQIDSFTSQLKNKKLELEGESPYEEILISAHKELKEKQKECEKKKAEIKQEEDLLPYYEFWVTAFGDKGIRKYIIDGIVPVLNSRLNYLLQYLVNGRIKLTFDNELVETVDRYPFDGKRYVYSGLSNGQRRRLILGVGQSFAYVQTASAGSCTSAFFLDEVCINQDPLGVQGIYRFICELAKERQVFIIDHNENLLNMLGGCETIYLQMQDEITKKVDSLD